MASRSAWGRPAGALQTSASAATRSKLTPSCLESVDLRPFWCSPAWRCRRSQRRRRLSSSAREKAVAIARANPVQGAAAIELFVGGLRHPWCLAFTPDGDILVTEKHHGLRVIRDGGMLPEPLAGTPPGVFAQADSGLLDIALDPDFAANRLVYLSFVEGDEAANRTAIWRARYENGRLADGRVIFRVAPDKAGPGHPGGRLLFLPDQTLLLTVGDGFEYKTAAQDLGSHLGKILRLTRDGKAAADNPFVAREGARPEIWTYGHRNPQGLARDAETGELWAHEHGPRGGDEINRLRAGANYGWPASPTASTTTAP